jgi:hypothetical protein
MYKYVCREPGALTTVMKYVSANITGAIFRFNVSRGRVQKFLYCVHHLLSLPQISNSLFCPVMPSLSTYYPPPALRNGFRPPPRKTLSMNEDGICCVCKTFEDHYSMRLVPENRTSRGSNPGRYWRYLRFVQNGKLLPALTSTVILCS